VLPNSPASKAGILPGDSVVSIAGVVPQSSDLARNIIGEQGTVPFTVSIIRNGESKDIVATLEFVKEVGRPALGVGIAEVGSVRYPPFTAMKVAAIATVGYTKAVVVTFVEIFRDLLSLKAPVEEVSGPIGIAVLSGQIARQGIIPLIQFAAILSINLAVINFLPIPALDGGRVLFLFIEKLRRRSMNQKIEAAIHNVSFIILIALILLVTMRDVFKFGGVILDGAKGLVGM
jgi:regulator of sigma E protease